MSDKLWHTDFLYVVTQNGTDLWEKHMDGAPVAGEDVDYGGWQWPGAGQLTEVFRQFDGARPRDNNLAGADMTCTPAAESPDGRLVEGDGFLWKLAVVEEGPDVGCLAWQASQITHIDSGDFPYEGLLVKGQPNHTYRRGMTRKNGYEMPTLETVFPIIRYRRTAT